MDRQIIYPGQIAVETDLLNTNRNTMISIGKLAGALFGTAGVTNGLTVGPSSPAALTVDVTPGEIYQLDNVDNTAYSSLPADTTDAILKQGIMLAKQTIACAAPGTTGFSVNYLIQATYQDSDTGAVALPYYNASNPSQAYSGPNNTGATQATRRSGIVVLNAKAGTAATTGTQTTPAADSGYIALASVTVANGQATIVAGNITAIAPASPPMVDTSAIYADLASTATGKGSSLVSFLQAGVSVVARWVRDKLREAPISAEDFGAVGDGVTDDYAAITAAMTAAASATVNKTVFFSKPVYAFATGLVVPQGVRLAGRGNAFGAWNGYTASTGTILRYIGTTGGGSKAVRFFAHNYGGGGMERIQVDSNNKADIGIELDGCAGLDFRNVSSFSSVAGADLKLIATTNAGVGNTAITCSWNTFTNCYLGTNTTGKACLWLTGVGNANTCHNTFVGLHIDHGGSRHAIVLGNCDNNTFLMTMITRGSGTGNGVYCDPTEQANFPETNTFHHLQAGAGGWYQPVTTISQPAIVWDYQLDNGQPVPVLNGTLLQYSTNWGLMTSELPSTPTLFNSWVSYGAPAGAPQYWKDRLGFVHLRGMAKNGTLGTSMFTLPAGYRPTSEEYFAVNSNGAFGFCYIKTDGSVMAQAGSNLFFSLSGITFRADYPQS